MGLSFIAHVPKYHGFAELRITDEDGNDIGIAVSDKQFDVLDERGAKESARRISVRNKALTKLAKSVPTIDVGAELIEFGRKQLPVIPNEPDATISIDQPGSQRRAILPVPVDSLDSQRRDDEIRRSNDEAVSLLSQFLDQEGRYNNARSPCEHTRNHRRDCHGKAGARSRAI
ncbi:hypothetical protein G6L28_08195 [Agrobacterium larrymoorei]|uniref:hypothetical protein n=1 Tax=Agrobacterium larrymoorei TaxID=160699 RepID=UPI001573C74B|nr:hypothetical protein [Agrobacterium larrymoorei]NTJ42577.1 hypothetical protein [Agrobacterium larrymoorei]